MNERASDSSSQTAKGGLSNPAEADVSLREQVAASALLTLGLAAIVVLRFGFVQGLEVTSINMAPTLVPDDRVLVRSYGADPALGDVIVYRSPFGNTDLQFGRIVALSGNRVELNEDGLFLDDRATSTRPADEQFEEKPTDPPGESPEIHVGYYESCPGLSCVVAEESLGDHRYFTRRAGSLSELLFSASVVPQGFVFVLSDNRVDERDSRIYGVIPVSAIVGVAAFVYYAEDESGVRWSRITRRVS